MGLPLLLPLLWLLLQINSSKSVKTIQTTHRRSKTQLYTHRHTHRRKHAHAHNLCLYTETEKIFGNFALRCDAHKTQTAARKHNSGKINFLLCLRVAEGQAGRQGESGRRRGRSSSMTQRTAQTSIWHLGVVARTRTHKDTRGSYALVQQIVTQF